MAILSSLLGPSGSRGPDEDPLSQRSLICCQSMTVGDLCRPVFTECRPGKSMALGGQEVVLTPHCADFIATWSRAAWTSWRGPHALALGWGGSWNCIGSPGCSGSCPCSFLTWVQYPGDLCILREVKHLCKLYFLKKKQGGDRGLTIASSWGRDEPWAWSLRKGQFGSCPWRRWEGTLSRERLTGGCEEGWERPEGGAGLFWWCFQPGAGRARWECRSRPSVSMATEFWPGAGEGGNIPLSYTGCYGRGWGTKITERDSQRPPRAHGAE